MLKFIRYAAWSAIVVVAFVSTAIGLGWWRTVGPGRPSSPGGVAITGMPQIGGSFTLTDQRGKSVSDKDFAGRPSLVFFGFTHCPDVCPTTLSEVSTRLVALGAEGDRLQVLFITADPERDTVEQLALYLSAFDPRITGLSGTPDQIAQVVKAYGAYARKVPTPSSYTMDHTASTFMMDAKGQFFGLIDYHETDATALAKLRRFLAAN